MTRKKVYFLIGLTLFALSLSACDVVDERDKPEVDLSDIFPKDLPSTGQAKRVNVDGKGESEWLVFYHIDLFEDDLEGSPTAAAMYRPVDNPDKRLPPYLVPTLLWLPKQGYVCLYTCEAELQDVMSGESNQGKELIVWDKRGNDRVGLAIFGWQKDRPTEDNLGIGGFVPLGHFRADEIEVKQDEVTLVRALDYRSDIAMREVYVPQGGRYYLEPMGGADGLARLLSPQEAEIVFAPGSLQDPANVKLPEKLVLAFYKNFENRAEIANYVDGPFKGEIADGCPPGVCGCVSQWKDVVRVQVKQIAYERASEPTASIVVQVRCLRKGDRADDPLETVTWRAQEQGNGTWRLTDVTLGGDVILCGSLDCDGP